jgi:hypothetical protein
MANTSRISGFRVVGNLSGGAATGQVHLYNVVSAADEILVGDIVKLGGTATASGVPTADLCGATDVPIGVVVAIVNPKLDQDGKITTGSITLDLPAATQIAASGTGFILVADDPDVIMEVEASNGTPAATDFGLNASHANGTRTSSTTTSPAYLDFGTEATTSTLNFQILGMPRRADNEIGASMKLLVRFNVHQYKSVGTTGI